MVEEGNEFGLVVHTRAHPGIFVRYISILLKKLVGIFVSVNTHQEHIIT